MSESKHTPGPWKRKDNFVYSPMFDEDDTLSVSIAVACTGIAPAIANANLIAAAPDMYEALGHLLIAAQKVCDDFCCGAGCSQDARDCKLEGGLIRAEIALRKARGETE